MRMFQEDAPYSEDEKKTLQNLVYIVFIGFFGFSAIVFWLISPWGYLLPREAWYVALILLCIGIVSLLGFYVIVETKVKEKELKRGEDKKVREREKLKTRQGLYSLTPKEFESAVAEILKVNGYTSVEVTKFVGDAGADIIACKDGRKYVVQCKQYSEGIKVGTPELQKLQGAMLGYRADAMIFVTLGFFSKNAVEYAQKNGIELIDGNELIDMARSIGNVL